MYVYNNSMIWCVLDCKEIPILFEDNEDINCVITECDSIFIVDWCINDVNNQCYCDVEWSCIVSRNNCIIIIENGMYVYNWKWKWYNSK